MNILSISNSAANTSKAVYEISRSRSFFGTSHLHLRLNCEPQIAWNKVRSLFVQILFEDETTGVIRGRIKEQKRGSFSRRMNQWFTVRFEARNPNHSLLVFEISIFFYARGVDGFVFDRLVDMLDDYGAKPELTPTWFTRFTANTTTSAEAISKGVAIPLSCTMLALVFLDYMLVGAWTSLRSDPLLSGFVTGIVLALTFFLIPVGLLMAIGFGVSLLTKRKHLVVTLIVLFVSVVAFILWYGFFMQTIKSFH